MSLRKNGVTLGTSANRFHFPKRDRWDPDARVVEAATRVKSVYRLTKIPYAIDHCLHSGMLDMRQATELYELVAEVMGVVTNTPPTVDTLRDFSFMVPYDVPSSGRPVRRLGLVGSPLAKPLTFSDLPAGQLRPLIDRCAARHLARTNVPKMSPFEIDKLRTRATGVDVRQGDTIERDFGWDVLAALENDLDELIMPREYRCNAPDRELRAMITPDQHFAFLKLEIVLAAVDAAASLAALDERSQRELAVALMDVTDRYGESVADSPSKIMPPQRGGKVLKRGMKKASGVQLDDLPDPLAAAPRFFHDTASTLRISDQRRFLTQLRTGVLVESRVDLAPAICAEYSGMDFNFVGTSQLVGPPGWAAGFTA